METFSEKIQTAVDDKVIAGAVLISADSDGIKFAEAYGSTSVQDGAAPMALDTVMWVASCTKLMTAVSALQCVERGLFTLDEPISRLIPEYASPSILIGFDGQGSPMLKPATKHVTLRQLLSHSSGMGYAGINPLLTRYRAQLGAPEGPLSSNITADYALPLTYEPGEGWDYSVGIDWAGKMVERANSNVRLGEYMAENVWKPLGMDSTTFSTSLRPDLAKRMCGMTLRQADKSLVHVPVSPYPISAPVDDCGGVGSLTCAADYIKLLSSLLRNDGKVLKPESVKELLRPQLADPKYLQAVLMIPEMGQFLAPAMPTGVEWNYGLGGIIAPGGVPGRAGRGCMWWGGLPNLQWTLHALGARNQHDHQGDNKKGQTEDHRGSTKETIERMLESIEEIVTSTDEWTRKRATEIFIDPDNGICGMYASQLLPPGDGRSAKLFGEFQKALFALDKPRATL